MPSLSSSVTIPLNRAPLSLDPLFNDRASDDSAVGVARSQEQLADAARLDVAIEISRMQADLDSLAEAESAAHASAAAARAAVDALEARANADAMREVDLEGARVLHVQATARLAEIGIRRSTLLARIALYGGG